MLSTIRKFNHNETLNITATVEATVEAISKSGSTFNIQEVIFALKSQGVEIEESKIRNRLNTMARQYQIGKINNAGWYIA